MNEEDQKKVADALTKYEQECELMDKFARETVSNLLFIARKRPTEFQSFFCGAIICNVVGNMTAEQWAAFEKIEPCGRPGCDCHLTQPPIIEALLLARIEHQWCCPRE